MQQNEVFVAILPACHGPASIHLKTHQAGRLDLFAKQTIDRCSFYQAKTLLPGMHSHLKWSPTPFITKYWLYVCLNAIATNANVALYVGHASFHQITLANKKYNCQQLCRVTLNRVASTRIVYIDVSLSAVYT